MQMNLIPPAINGVTAAYLKCIQHRYQILSRSIVRWCAHLSGWSDALLQPENHRDLLSFLRWLEHQITQPDKADYTVRARGFSVWRNSYLLPLADDLGLVKGQMQT